MTRLVIIEDRPKPGGPLKGPTGMAVVHLAGSGLLTVDLALPGHAGYRCVTALGSGSGDIPILALVGCDQSSPETALGARLRAFVRRERALRLAHVAGWPSTLGLPPREFDRLMAVVRRCGRLTTQPERQYLLNVRSVGFLATTADPAAEYGTHSDAWHAMQFAIVRAAQLERRAIA